MSFTDLLAVAELCLGTRVTMRGDDAYASWYTGKVTELALLGDDYHDIRVTLLLDDGTEVRFDRDPEHNVILGDG
jgi:hypothetical protein